MPGIVVFRRRWGVGSDDLVLPGISLSILHIVWLSVVIVTLALDASAGSDGAVAASNRTDVNVTQWDDADDGWLSDCGWVQRSLLSSHVVLALVSLMLEMSMAYIALKGTMWNVAPRESMEYIVYTRLLVLVAEFIWSSMSIVWLPSHYFSCPAGLAKEVLLGSVICNLCVVLSVFITAWCTFDRAGRSWVKMKRFQQSVRDGETKFHYKRSGNNRPNWRQRKVMRTYQSTWDHRCKILFCCMGTDQYQDSFSEIARLLTDFFRDLDLVPTDIMAGLVLLRRDQKSRQETLVRQNETDIYEFLSGVGVTSKTRFLCLNEAEQLEAFQLTAHYMKFALAAYGWPMYLLGHSSNGLCLLCTDVRWCCSGNSEPDSIPVVIGDTCSGCHMAALKQSCGDGDYQVIYATFHVDVSETPFFIAVDYDHRSVVVSIRGTISMKDVITDLHAEAEPIPYHLHRHDWLGHKGMVQSALYIHNKLESENLLGRAFSHNADRGTPDFQLVLVGHSLGAGTAAILALLLRHDYPTLHCYAYSPPGGLLSLPAAEFTKQFVTSVVVGKDVVPRLGLHQLETLRTSLMTAIKKSTTPKWNILGSGLMCCDRRKELLLTPGQSNVEEGLKEVPLSPVTGHSSDVNITLPTHQPLYPPGQIIHIVRQHPKADGEKTTNGETTNKSGDPIYQAIWADTVDFDEVLISPVMVQDHMPDTVLRALNKVLSCHGPSKPQRVTATLPAALPAPLPDTVATAAAVTAAVTPKPYTYLFSSLTSIDKSPTLDQRNFDPASSRSSSLMGASASKRLSWLHPETMDRLRRRASDILPFGWGGSDESTPLDKHSLEVYTSFLVAPMAAAENLSDESVAGSRTSLPKRRAHNFWKMPRMRWECESSVGDATESSSVYCASPLSTVRRKHPAVPDSASVNSTRAQLKKEIMRLYQRAAADLDANAAGSGGSGSASGSPPASSVSQSLCPFAADGSPVFGTRGSRCTDDSSHNDSPFQRPATTDGQRTPDVDNQMPPCNTSF